MIPAQNDAVQGRSMHPGNACYFKDLCRIFRLILHSSVQQRLQVLTEWTGTAVLDYMVIRSTVKIEILIYAALIQL